MKLLFILPEYVREQTGGIRTFYCNLLPALAKAGCRVQVLLACRGRFDEPSYTDEAGVVVEYLRSDLFEKHSRIFASSYLAGQPTLGHYVPVGMAAYEQARAGEGYDLVELTDWPFYFLPWVCRGSKVPFTISLHSSIGQMRFFEPMPGWELETHFLRLLEAACFSSAPSVHTNSKLNARYWEGITNRKVDVLLPLMAKLTTKDTNTHERGEKFGALSKELAGEASLTTTGKARALEEEQPKVGPKGEGVGTSESKITECTELEAGVRLAGQAGASEPDSLASELAESPVSESLTRSASSTASSPATSYPLANTAPEVPLLDSGRSPLAPQPRVRGAVFARLQNWKGAEVLLEALRLVPGVTVDWYGRSVPSAHGKRTYAEELQEKFPDVFGRQLVHHGVVAHEEALAAMRNAAFVCVPSIWDVFNLTVIEAMEQWSIVICSRQAGAEMLIEHGNNGFLFDPEKPESLAIAMQECAQMSAQEREMMARLARETISDRFNPSGLIPERLRYYRDAAQKGPFLASNTFLEGLLPISEVADTKRRTLLQKVVSKLVAELKKHQ